MLFVYVVDVYFFKEASFGLKSVFKPITEQLSPTLANPRPIVLSALNRSVKVISILKPQGRPAVFHEVLGVLVLVGHQEHATLGYAQGGG